MSSKPPDIHLNGNDSIELIDFEHKQSPIPFHTHTDHSEDDTDSDKEDDASRALLGFYDYSTGPIRLARSAGELWPQVQSIVIEHWRAMREVHQLIIIIPVILNLKGNLEMNLSARLGTAANVGDLDEPTTRNLIIGGNLSLLQVQAAVVSFIAGWIAMILGIYLPRTTLETLTTSTSNNLTDVASRGLRYFGQSAGILPRRPIGFPKDNYSTFTFPKLVMVASTGMTAACLSSVVLGFFMSGLIVLCRLYGLDPDNIAPPVASCLGDLVSLLFMGVVSALLINIINTAVPSLLVVSISGLAIFCFIVTLRNPHARPLLAQGWIPLFGAMVISSGTGIVLDRFASRYDGYALLGVMISGLPGAVGSILISRLSTSMHVAALSRSSSGAPRLVKKKGFSGPSTRLVLVTLLLVTIPVDILFLSLLLWFNWLHLPIAFAAFSILFFFLAALISLLVAKYLTDFLWSKDCDPDVYALPIHSAFIDLVSHLILAGFFEIAGLFINVRPTGS
ncbi:hypothetical protein H0H92_015999 [Tricholoma furcatifolium]|nr:hypothetical protein H0H92_015999 [Tricholoma furcatifolium]